MVQQKIICLIVVRLHILFIGILWATALWLGRLVLPACLLIRPTVIK